MRRTQLYRKMPWVGGINTSVDPGVLNPQELVQADNVQFSTTGARIKRNALTYLDLSIGAPDVKASSGTTRTLTWTSSILRSTVTPDQRLVVGERITVTGDSNYNVVGTSITSMSSIAEVTQVTCVADAGGSLAGKYFLISASDPGIDFYVWYKVSGTGADPGISGRTGIEVDISTNDTAATVASASRTALIAHPQFSATDVGPLLTVTSTLAGYVVDPAAGTSGFTVNVTMQGGWSISYTLGSSFSQAATAATGVSVARASSVIMVKDYWHFSGGQNVQSLVYATDHFQLFKLDDAGRRTQILGQTQVTQLTTQTSAQVTSGDYFLLNTPNGGTLYYVWYNKAGGGGDPAPAGRTAIEVDIGPADSDATIASDTATAITSAAGSDFTAVTNSAPIILTSVTCGADVSGSLASKYFLLEIDGADNSYYVWYKVSGVGSDPMISGKIPVEIDINTNDPSSAVAFNTSLAINQLGGTGVFTSSAVGAVISIHPAVTGSTQTILAGNSGFAVHNFQAGVLITAKNQGVTEETTNVNTQFAFSTVDFGATAPANPVKTIRPNVFNERLQIYFSGVGNFPIIYNPDESPEYRLMGDNPASGLTMPDASFAFNYLSRVFTNDKNRTDYLHFCQTFDETQWLGIGDSGAVPIFPGDGDPEGITNAYAYKGLVIVSKKDARFRVQGDSPENFLVMQISAGMGNEGSCAVAVDEMDTVFISRRGVHSQQVTDAYGDTESNFLSTDIKPTFHTWNPSALNLMQGTYVPELNSIALSVAESGKSAPNAVWLYNFVVQVPNKTRLGAWYRWPNVSCTALSRRLTNGIHKIIMGTNDGRVVQAQTENSFADFGVSGIPFTIKTGTIYPGDDPQSMKAFKKLTMIYRPQGNFTFNVLAKVDNHSPQGFAFSQSTGFDLLGETFILGHSTLGSTATLAPFTFTMEGYGRGLTLTISQPSAEQQLELWGFVVEYENVDLEQETE